MDDLKKLKTLASNVRILYVEDNDKLRENASHLLHKFFDTIDIAVDGEDGLRKFKEHLHSLVITDIKMPNMDGISLSREIKAIRADTKIIIMSAFDDKENLYTANEIGVFRFLKKPVNLNILTDVLYEVLQKIKDEEARKLFYKNVSSSFNNQSSMVVMFDEERPIVANTVFLEFFEVETLDEFAQKHGDLGLQFMEYEGFLYNTLDKNWFEELKNNEKKHFHVKIKNKQNRVSHLIISYKKPTEPNHYGVLSLEDITDLNYSNVAKKEPVKSEDKPVLQDAESLFALFQTAKENGVKLDLHNYYKGLSITNTAEIKEIKKDSIILKTAYLQVKAMQFESKTIVDSEIFPHTVECDDITQIGYDMEYVELKNCKFVKTSPVGRKTVRVVPSDNYTISLFIGKKEFKGDIKIEDISLDAVKLRLDSLPAGLERGEGIVLNIILDMDGEEFVLNTNAVMFRKEELQYSFSIVFVFENLKKTLLVKYITKRQMAIIREFKGLQNER